MAAIALTVGISLSVLAREFDPGWIESRRDVDTYYWAGEVVRSAGEPMLLYFGDPEEIWPFMYPPSFAAAWGMATGLPRRTAYLLWAGLLLTATLLLCVAASGGSGWWYPLALLPYLLMVLRAGQVDVLMVLLVLGFLESLRRKGAPGGGFALAAGVHLKLYPVLALPALAIGRRWKELAGVLGWTTALLLLPLLWLVPTYGAEAPTQLFALYGTYVLRLLVQPAWGLSWTALVPWWLVGPVLVAMLAGAYRLAFRGDPEGAVRLAVPAGVLCSPVFFPYSALVLALLIPRLRGLVGQMAVAAFGGVGALAWLLGRPVTIAVPVVCFGLWMLGWRQLTAEGPEDEGRSSF